MTAQFLASLRHISPRAGTFAALVAATSLAGCINSAAPILSGGKPQFGQEARFYFYGLNANGASEPEQARYRWDGHRYVYGDGGYKDTGAFTIHPLAGRNFIVQSFNAEPGKPIDYAIAHSLAAGVFLVTVIDEHEANAAMRDKYCVKGTACRIETREALMAFARVTAAKSREQGGLAVLVRGKK